MVNTRGRVTSRKRSVAPGLSSIPSSLSSERLEKAAEIIAAAIYNARPYPRSWGEYDGTPGGALHDHFMEEGRRKLQEVMRCLGMIESD